MLLELALKHMLFFALHFEQSKFPEKLTKAQETEYFRQLRHSEDPCVREHARDELISHNIRLVAYIVRRNYPDCKDVDDMIQIGCIGLMSAVDTFDPDKNIKFSTYATTCIDNQIKMKLRKTKNEPQTDSIDTPVGTNEDNRPTAHTIPDPDEIDKLVDDLINSKIALRCIEECLDERERKIICLRYGIKYMGLHFPGGLTQNEVAKMMNISRSYVSRIEKKAIQKLRECFGVDENEI
jgi:RNA polymerase sporulation-specific sigma factor